MSSHIEATLFNSSTALTSSIKIAILEQIFEKKREEKKLLSTFLGRREMGANE